ERYGGRHRHGPQRGLPPLASRLLSPRSWRANSMTNSLITRRGLVATGGLAAAGAAALPLLGGQAFAADSPTTLLNVSYDPTRELYKEINAAYATYWK